MTYRILDLFCGAGGAAVGYHQAGFEVVGVDIKNQPNYPFEFWQADALDILRGVRQGYWPDFDAIHASPPCQGYSRMSSCRPGLAEKYPKLIWPVRELLSQIDLPYIIENVPQAPLLDPIVLCGWTFGYETYRHRLFEVRGFEVERPQHRKHETPAAKAGHWVPGKFVSVSGNCAPIAMSRKVMDIDWMTRAELTESIPPYFSEYVGNALRRHLETTSNQAAA